MKTLDSEELGRWSPLLPCESLLIKALVFLSLLTKEVFVTANISWSPCRL